VIASLGRRAPEWSAAVHVEGEGRRALRRYRRRPESLAHLLGDFGRWADRDALVAGPRRISFAQHLAGIEVLARELRRRGVCPGDHVMLLAANSPEWVTAFWAAARIGAVVALGNAWWSAVEIAHAVAEVGPVLVVADERRIAVLVPDVPVLSVDAIEGLTRAGLPVEPLDVPKPAESDPALIIFTSGTEGRAKGVVLSHRSVVANIQNLLVRTRRLPSELSPDHQGTVSLMCLPLFHIGGIQTLITGQLSGGRMLFLTGRFDPEEVLELIERERVRFFGGVPTMISRVLDCPALSSYDTSSIVSVAMGGSLVVPELAERIARGFPNARRSMTNIYGQTEAGGALTAAGGTELLDHPGCVGRPLPLTELRIHDPDEDGVGEILARSATLMSEFVDGSVTPVDAQGWLHTGDLGRIDDDGYLYLVGRSREIIIRGGENIAPGNVENRLLKHPAVLDVAVVGVPQADLGEEVAAAIVLRPGCTAESHELADFAAAELARFEIPTRWWIGIDTLPLNSAQKVSKRDLVAGWTDIPPIKE
jgi:long-chain acyl-CoA synthetase